MHFSKSAAYKYMSGKRKPISIRIDTGLYSRFKPLSKRIYGSTCKAIEIYIIALIEAAETGVHFSDTAKPIQIEKIVIERKLRERRNLELKRNAETGENWIKCGLPSSLISAKISKWSNPLAERFWKSQRKRSTHGKDVGRTEHVRAI